MIADLSVTGGSLKMTNLDLLRYAHAGMVSELRDMEINLVVYGIDSCDVYFFGALRVFEEGNCCR